MFLSRSQKAPGSESGGICENSITFWQEFLQEPKTKSLIPEGYPKVGCVPISKPISKTKTPIDPILNVLPLHEINEYKPATWGPQAITNSFYKHTAKHAIYLPPHDFPDLCKKVDHYWKRHFHYLNDTRVVNIMATEKNLDSTPGYPKMVAYDSERDFLEANGWGPYHATIKQIMQGENPTPLWYVFLKSEILKQEKIKNSDIRQIICPDPIVSRIGCMLDQHQNQIMKNNTEAGYGQCGWSPFQNGFRRRCMRLKSKNNNNYIEMDWTRFDGTIPIWLLAHIRRMRWNFINKKHRKRWQKLADWYNWHLLHRFQLLQNGEITYVEAGNPSGQISTTMDNNMVNVWLQYYEYFYLGGTEEELKYFDTIVYGDDRLTTLRTLPHNYAERVIKMYEQHFGMWVKPENVKIQDTLVGLSFCGNTINTNYDPIPQRINKLWASLITPVKRLPNPDALHCKLLCFQLLMYNCGDHPFKEYLEIALSRSSRYCSPELPARFTEEQMETIWRGGPK
nr:RNA-dependent RNA polymerase [Bamboo rat astrovirus]